MAECSYDFEGPFPVLLAHHWRGSDVPCRKDSIPKDWKPEVEGRCDHLTRLIQRGTVSADRFRLTSFGLPEPVPAGAERQRWWLILLATGVALLGLWRFLNSRRGER
jgi:hypothetical protein